jgi:outer membrane protein assembly factor BamB
MCALAGLLGAPCHSQTLFTAGVPVWTQHNDNLRTGVYPNESRITVSSLESRGMRRMFAIPLPRQVETQVLYVPNVVIGGNNHKVAYVSTLGNQVLAFDVDTGAQLWSVPLPSDSNPGGIHATPVIDAPNSTMYVLYRTSNYCTNNPACSDQQDQSASVFFTVAALDIRTGATLRAQTIPAILSTSYGDLPFIPSAQASRPGLLLDSYGLYVAFGAWSEGSDPYRGWILRINPSTLMVESAFTPSPGQQEHSASGFWQSGGGIASDEGGNIFIPTGNGPPDCHYAAIENDCSAPGRGAAPFYGGTLLKLGPQLNFAAIFEPDGPDFPASNTGIEWFNRDDLDYGSGGVVLLPGSGTAHNVISGGKPGRLYLTDDRLNPRQGFQAFFNMYLSDPGLLPAGRNYPPYWDGNGYPLDDNPHLHGTPVYWRGPDPNYGYLYAWSEKDNLKAFKYYVNIGSFGASFTPIPNNSRPWAAHCPSTNSDLLCNGLISPNETVCSGDRSAIMPGGMLSLSANGTIAGTGVVWATLRTTDPSNRCQTRDKLLAYDAQTLRLIWQDDFGWANNAPVDATPKWGVPTIADGKLLVGTMHANGTGRLLIYELPVGPPTAVRATAASKLSPIRVTWAIDDPGTDSFQVQVSGGPQSEILSANARNYVLGLLSTGLGSQIRVCSYMRAYEACSPWTQPIQTSQNAWFTVTKAELDQTAWGFADIRTVPWARAARAAFGFCTNNGFVGGQLTGDQTLDPYNIVTSAGAVCNGSSQARFFDSTSAERSASAWVFTDVNTVGWAQASRLADEYCRARSYVGGQFDGNELNGLMGIVCYQGTWFDLPKPETGLSATDLNLLADWSAAALAAVDACARRQKNATGGHGRFNGWQSNTSFGAVCY